MTVDGRLPAHLEVAALIRMVETAGGFASVLHKGEKDAGTIIILTMYRGEAVTLFERMPDLEGGRPYIAAKRENPENKQEIYEYLKKRERQDPDIWVIEADIADAERFIAQLPR